MAGGKVPDGSSLDTCAGRGAPPCRRLSGSRSPPRSPLDFRVEISLHRRFAATFGRPTDARALARSFTFDSGHIAAKRRKADSRT
jgi:hypothetical protein